MVSEKKVIICLSCKTAVRSTVPTPRMHGIETYERNSKEKSHLYPYVRLTVKSSKGNKIFRKSSHLDASDCFLNNENEGLILKMDEQLGWEKINIWKRSLVKKCEVEKNYKKN